MRSPQTTSARPGSDDTAIVVVRDEPDCVELSYGAGTVVVSWQDGCWILAVKGWTRPLVCEIAAHGTGYYDPGDGLPDPYRYIETHPEIPDAPAGWTRRAAERYRRDSRAPAIAAAYRLARALVENDDRTPFEAEAAMHRGWRRPRDG